MTPTDKVIEDILRMVVERVSRVDGVVAIVLGGSRARGTADELSDIDLGLYYDAAHPFSTEALNEAARELDDRHTPGLVTAFGEWGPGVNGGGWLVIQSNHVDFLYRELGAVRSAVEECVAGRPSSVYQLGHPMGFHNQIPVGEIQVCEPLFDPTGAISGLKSAVTQYPEALRSAVVKKHLFDAAFELGIAVKGAERGDVMYVAGCLFRAAGFMTLVLYALNRKFYLNDKGAFAESQRFAIKPPKFHETAARILGQMGTAPAELSASVAGFQKLVEEFSALNSP